MFSSFKNIVNNSLQELDRLGESSFGLPQQQQQGQEQQQQQRNIYQDQGPGGQNSTDGFFPARRTHGDQQQQQLYANTLAGSRRSPNMQAKQYNNTNDGRSSPMPFVSPPAGHTVPIRMRSPSVSSSRPVSSSGPAAESNSSRSRERRESSESFPDFGFSNLKRSLSGMNKASLDLTGIRSSFDLGRPSTSGGSPTTPSRDFGRPEPSSAGPPVRPSLSLSGGRKRKSSARSFSVSGLTGVYTPDTMMRQDPFFFAALQALPDDLKIAAFTPLPTEDDDEYLEGIDNELKTQASTFPSGLPAISTSGLRKYGSASFSGPSSAPAAGFMRPSFGTPPAVRSPLLEPGQSILGRLEDHLEEEERASAHPSPLASAPPLPDNDSDTATPEHPRTPAAIVEKADPAPVIQEPKPVDEQGTESGLGLNIPSPSFSQPDTGASSRKTPAEHTNASDNHPLAVPAVTQTTSRPVSPALPPKHESLQARLARLAKSRAKGAAVPSQAATETGPSAAGSPSAVTPMHTEVDTSTQKSENASPPDRSGGTLNSGLSTTGNTKASGDQSHETVASSSIETLLRRYIPISSLDDTTAIEDFLKKRVTSAGPSGSEIPATGSTEAAARDESDNLTISTLEAELKEVRAAATRAEAKAKEEEEKKAKSISLLKAVRQKLLKAEKDKEESEVMRDAFKASEEALKSELRQRTQRLENEIMSTRSGQEREISRLKASFDREAQSIRAAADREAAAKRGQYELDMLNLRSAQSRELQQRDGRIGMLETNLRDLRREKDALFAQLQAKQAEVESATTSQERAQVAYDELQYELKDARDRIAALQEEVHSFKKARLDQTRDEGHTRRLLSELESNNADRIKGFEDRIRTLEKERSEAEDNMAKKLQEKLREVENMRREIERRDAENSEETHRREERQQRVERAEKQNIALQDKVNALEMLLNEARIEISRVKEEQATTQELLADQTRRVTEVESRNEDLLAKEGQLRIANKNLREELRKVQAGILLAEKSRNPGVGYFSSFSQSNAGSPSASNINLTSASGAKSPPLPTSPGLGITNGNNNEAINQLYHQRRESTTSLTSEGAIARAGGSSDDEALNFEYIRNVILQFLEHKEMRPHLVGVLGVILHFTPAETRRLTSKASA